MKEDDKELERIRKILDEIKTLLRQSIAIQLSLSGETQDEIAQNMKTSKTTVNQMLKGMKKDKTKVKDESI